MNAFEPEFAEQDYLIGSATPDAYGVPLNIMGNRSEEFFATMGRIVGLGANLENKALGFLQYLVGRDQHAHTELNISRIIDTALKELHRLPQVDREFAREFLVIDPTEAGLVPRSAEHGIVGGPHSLE